MGFTKRSVKAAIWFTKGRKIRVFFRFFIRPEQDFGSIERLKEQLSKDAALV